MYLSKVLYLIPHLHHTIQATMVSQLHDALRPRHLSIPLLCNQAHLKYLNHHNFDPKPIMESSFYLLTSFWHLLFPCSIRVLSMFLIILVFPQIIVLIPFLISSPIQPSITIILTLFVVSSSNLQIFCSSLLINCKFIYISISHSLFP